MEPTIIRYLGSFVTVALNVILVVAILGYFGVETTSFAALIAAVGITIGSAWAGLLSNFAAGAFILILRRSRWATTSKAAVWRYGDRNRLVWQRTQYAGQRSPTMVGNSKIMGGNIKNFSARLNTAAWTWSPNSMAAPTTTRRSHCCAIRCPNSQRHREGPGPMCTS